MVNATAKTILIVETEEMAPPLPVVVLFPFGGDLQKVLRVSFVSIQKIKNGFVAWALFR